MHVVPKDDDDLDHGRFARRYLPHDRMSLLSTTSTTACEDKIKDFFAKEFEMFFGKAGDVTLFLKICSADGIVLCLALDCEHFYGSVGFNH